MRDFRMIFGSVRHMALIGEDPEFKALRHRNEQRLVALKATHRLYEDKSESTTSRNESAELSAYPNAAGPLGCAYVPGAALGSILGYPLDRGVWRQSGI